WRHFWILLLTVSMAPFFIFVYYLIIETSKPHYDLLVLNQDKGIRQLEEEINYGSRLLEGIKKLKEKHPGIPLTIKKAAGRSKAVKMVKNKKADALVIIPENFSEHIHNFSRSGEGGGVNIEFIGDLTNFKYMISAVWANEFIDEYVFALAGKTRPIKIKETALGVSGNVDDFHLVVPGLLILSIIMMMLTATIAVVTEVENKTLTRLKLSKLTALQYLSGVGFVQLAVGVISILLTLLTAVLLGFRFPGSSIGILILIAVLTSISIIAFSLMLAAVTKTANEVLIVGNFPLFLLMFFTGAAFPLGGKALFTVAGYPITIQGVMSPTHAINALKKVLIMRMGLTDILPELAVLIIITVIYFMIGVWAFNRRHMKIE
ncbi:MAG: ABC transporter permease, partial [bacterium]|nr:ABC transporter permease [bacterium]